LLSSLPIFESITMMRRNLIITGLLLLNCIAAFSQQDLDARDAFVKAQNEYLSQLQLDFYQNKEYQIITRNFDKQVMKVNLANVPKGVKNKRIKRLKKEKDQKMKILLNPRQYKLYIRRQKVIDKTISDDW
jgi:hypothetical protein